MTIDNLMPSATAVAGNNPTTPQSEKRQAFVYSRNPGAIALEKLQKNEILFAAAGFYDQKMEEGLWEIDELIIDFNKPFFYYEESQIKNLESKLQKLSRFLNSCSLSKQAEWHATATLCCLIRRDMLRYKIDNIYRDTKDKDNLLQKPPQEVQEYRYWKDNFGHHNRKSLTLDPENIRINFQIFDYNLKVTRDTNNISKYGTIAYKFNRQNFKTLKNLSRIFHPIGSMQKNQFRETYIKKLENYIQTTPDNVEAYELMIQLCSDEARESKILLYNDSRARYYEDRAEKYRKMMVEKFK